MYTMSDKNEDLMATRISDLPGLATSPPSQQQVPVYQQIAESLEGGAETRNNAALSLRQHTSPSPYTGTQKPTVVATQKRHEGGAVQWVKTQLDRRTLFVMVLTTLLVTHATPAKMYRFFPQRAFDGNQFSLVGVVLIAISAASAYRLATYLDLFKEDDRK
jgi:hypothetical protein